MSTISEISSTSRVYLKEVCRVCLNDETSELHDLFETHAPEMLQFCGFLEVKELDDFPKKICSACIANINTSYELKQLCESSKSYFQSLLDLTMLDPELKVESDEDEVSVKSDPECGIDRTNESLSEQEVQKGNIEVDETSSQGVIEEPVKFQCQKCRKGLFEHENDLFIHQSIHNPEMICNQCEKSFESLLVLKRHVKTHMVFKRYTCKYCPKGFTDSGAVSKHIKRHHFKLPTDKKHECSYCGKKFVDKKYRLVHERKHTGETPLQCSVCDKSFYDPSSFKAHLDAHFGIKLHLCPECGKSFVTSSLLKQHQNVHNKQRHMCNGCGMYLSQARTLKSHQKLCFKKLRSECTKLEEDQNQIESNEVDEVDCDSINVSFVRSNKQL